MDIPSSGLAAASTLHVCLLAARQHRSRPTGALSLVLLPALVFAASPWLWPSLMAVAVAGVLHLAWFFICESVLPAVGTRATGSQPSARPSVPATRPSPPAHAAAPDRSPVTVPVLAVFDETADIRTFRIQRPSNFEFAAGQFLTVRVHVDGKPLQRAYSISSAPEARGYLEISVKRLGVVSQTLHASLRPGSLLTVRPPAGSFAYPRADDRPLVLIAGGVGITPLISMLRHATASDPTRPVTLLYSVRTPEDIGFRDDLRTLVRRHPQVRFGLAVTRGPASDQWHAGRIDERFLRTYSRDVIHSLVYICGPQEMIDAMKALLASVQVPAGQVRSESFGAAMKLVTSEETGEGAPQETAAGGRTAAGATVRFARSGCAGQVSAQQTLLEAAETHGVELPSVCRAGECHTCLTRLLEGEVDSTAETLSAEDRDAGYILPCVSWARTDCTLEA